MKQLYDPLTGKRRTVTNEYHNLFMQEYAATEEKIKQVMTKNKRCERCGRKIKESSSRTRMLGPVCHKILVNKRQSKINFTF